MEQRQEERLRVILSSHGSGHSDLIPILLEVQADFSYLPEEAIQLIASSLNIAEGEIYSVATFYAQFRFERQGEHTIKCCQGTACYVQGGHRIVEAVEDELELEVGETTTRDYKFSLEKVACFGSCALAPVMVVDKTVYGRLTPVKARQIVAEY
ncbi:MAG: NAD(P)H-dependent oxidoreductase subunit E [Dehalococcoidales bacterium]|nr:NAD(P)H-dependent oxidoreductase subunit E [Dehalococcoidales bacterium]